MTQISFSINEIPTASRLNQATQGYKFLRRTTYAGSAGSSVGNAIFATATWTPGQGTASVYVRAVGAGGGSWSARAGSPANTSGAASGAGGGGYSEGWIMSGFTPSQTIQIGLGGQRSVAGGNPFAGGQSKFGSLISAGGGVPGGFLWNIDGSGNAFVGGGLGGTGSGGNINASGIAGGIGCVLPVNIALSGRGGQSAFGGPGGQERVSGGGGANGFPGGLYGGGGGGAVLGNASSLLTFDGGDGAPGFVIVDEWA